MLRDAGFVDIQVDVKEESAKYIAEWMPGSGAEEFVASASITARKQSAGAPATAARPQPKKSSDAGACGPSSKKSSGACGPSSSDAGACGPSSSGSKKGG